MAERAVAVILLSSFSLSLFCFPLSLCTFEPFRSQYCGGRKSCQLVNTSHELRLVMCWADAPPPPDFNVEVFALGGAWRVANKLPVNIEIGGARGGVESDCQFQGRCRL